MILGPLGFRARLAHPWGPWALEAAGRQPTFGGGLGGRSPPSHTSNQHRSQLDMDPPRQPACGVFLRFRIRFRIRIPLQGGPGSMPLASRKCSEIRSKIGSKIGTQKIAKMAPNGLPNGPQNRPKNGKIGFGRGSGWRLDFGGFPGASQDRPMWLKYNKYHIQLNVGR